jgi:hypothetical protein
MANLSNINNKFLVTTGGNVLIGQTSAIGSSIFQVTGNATFAGNVDLGDSSNISMNNAAAGQLQVKGAGYTGAIALDATAMYVYHNSSLRDLVLGTNEVARLTIDGSSGNVGIGVSDPDSKLDVNAGITSITAGPAMRISKGASPVGLIRYDTLVIEGNDVPTIRFGESDGTVSTIASGDNNLRINTTGDIKFYTSGTATGEGHGGQGGTFAMVIATNQNVGIGANPPASVLHIKDSSAGPTQLSIQSNDFTRAEEINFLNPSTSAISGQIKYYTNPTVEYMSFSTSNNSAAVERMRISNTLITVPTITELRADIAAKFAIGNMGGASSQMMVTSRGFLTFNVSNTGSGLDATERMRITSEGQIQFPRTGQPPITNSLYGNIVLDSNAVTNFQRIRYDVGTTPYWGLTRLNSGNFAITGGSTWNDHAFSIQYSTQNVGVGMSSGVFPGKFNVSGNSGLSTTGVGDGIFVGPYQGNSAVGSNWSYSNSGYTYTDFCSRYDSSSSFMRFIMKASATPVYAMTIRGDGKVGIGTDSPVANTKLDVVGAIKTQTVAHSWYRCGPITSGLAYRHIKTNLHMGGGARGNDEYIMGGFEIKGYAYYGSYAGFGHGTCMFHNWSGGFASLDVRNFAMAGFVQQPYVSSDGFCVIVLRQNTYMQPVIDFCQYYTPYPWRTSVVTAESASANLTGVY